MNDTGLYGGKYLERHQLFLEIVEIILPQGIK